MNKKDKLIELFKASIDDNAEYIAVAIETKGSEDVEIIVNTRKNFDNKLAYYCKAYNDDLILNTYDGIRIVGVLEIKDDIPIDMIYDGLLYSEF